MSRLMVCWPVLKDKAQKLITCGATTGWWSVISGVLQSSVLGTGLFFLMEELDAPCGARIWGVTPLVSATSWRGEERGAGLCFLVPTDNTYVYCSELQQGRFRLTIRKHFFTESIAKPWIRLTRKVDDAPNLSVFKRHLLLNNILLLLVSPEMIRQLD